MKRIDTYDECFRARRNKVWGDFGHVQQQLTKRRFVATIVTTMSQDLLIKLVTAGNAKGVGKGHVYYTRFNNKVKKDPSKKYETKKFNPIAKEHTVYKQKK